jgi:hypothetical protein
MNEILQPWQLLFTRRAKNSADLYWQAVSGLVNSQILQSRPRLIFTNSSRCCLFSANDQHPD